jgi:hypothetical protein
LSLSTGFYDTSSPSPRLSTSTKPSSMDDRSLEDTKDPSRANVVSPTSGRYSQTGNDLYSPQFSSSVQRRAVGSSFVSPGNSDWMRESIGSHGSTATPPPVLERLGIELDDLSDRGESGKRSSFVVLPRREDAVRATLQLTRLTRSRIALGQRHHPIPIPVKLRHHHYTVILEIRIITHT